MKNFLLLLTLIALPVYISSIFAQKSEFNKNGLIWKQPNATTKITICTDQIIRVQYIPVDSKNDHQSLVVINKWETPISFTTKIEGKKSSLLTKTLKITLDESTGLISFYDQKNNLLLSEKERMISPKNIMNEDVFNIKQTWQLDKNEALYGLGGFQKRQMNLRNYTDSIVNTNPVDVNPFMISTKSYGILWDNYSFSIYKDDGTGTSLWSEVADKIDYYFVAGNTMDEAISGYRAITGQAPMFGKWALGYWQCKERYKDFDELKAVAKKYRELKLPIDNIVQDWNYWAQYDPNDNDKTWASAKDNWSSMKFDPSTYKDPEAAIKQLHEDLNMHYMISIWPQVGPKTDIYKEMEQKGYLYPPITWASGKLYDAFNKDARDLYWKHVKKGIMDYGADALWMDGTEPEAQDQHTVNSSLSNIKSLGNNKLGTMARYLNAYSLMTTEGIYQNFRKDFPEKRLFILTRSSFSGQQRNAAATWSGDINSNFEILKDQITAGLNFSMAGIPYWTTDIGGFFTSTTEDKLKRGRGLYPDGNKSMPYRELYVRWFQYGAFSPLFRSHGTGTEREMWYFGDKGDWSFDALLKYNHLRYRLLPYIYSLSWKVTHEGYTIMRGMAMDFPKDKMVYDIKDQFMFGSNFLVAPITEHQYFPIQDVANHSLSNIKSRNIYLPSGTDWYDFWTGEKVKGGQTLNRQTPIDIMPLYVKSGSIIPMGPFVEYSTQKPADPIELRIYTGNDGKFTLYEDENDNYNYEKGIYATIDFEWNEATKTLTIDDRKGEFPGMIKTRIFKIVWVNTNHGVGEQLADTTDEIISYTGKKLKTIKKI